MQEEAARPIEILENNPLTDLFSKLSFFLQTIYNLHFSE